MNATIRTTDNNKLFCRLVAHIPTGIAIIFNDIKKDRILLEYILLDP